jgi:hypothetical protein
MSSGTCGLCLKHRDWCACAPIGEAAPPVAPTLPPPAPLLAGLAFARASSGGSVDPPRDLTPSTGVVPGHWYPFREGEYLVVPPSYRGRWDVRHGRDGGGIAMWVADDAPVAGTIRQIAPPRPELVHNAHTGYLDIYVNDRPVGEIDGRLRRPEGADDGQWTIVARHDGAFRITWVEDRPSPLFEARCAWAELYRAKVAETRADFDAHMLEAVVGPMSRERAEFIAGVRALPDGHVVAPPAPPPRTDTLAALRLAVDAVAARWPERGATLAGPVERARVALHDMGIVERVAHVEQPGPHGVADLADATAIVMAVTTRALTSADFMRYTMPKTFERAQAAIVALLGVAAHDATFAKIKASRCAHGLLLCDDAGCAR